MVVNSVHWFRKGLRLHDNPSLQEALIGADSVCCVYILDPWFAGSANVGLGINRWRFLLESLEDLDNSLRKLNSRLFVVRGQPTDVFPRLFKEWNVTRLTFEYDPEPFGKERDGAIIKVAHELGVETIEWNVTRLTFEYDPEPFGKERDGAIIKVAHELGVETIVRNSHTLYNLDRIVEMNNNNPPLTFKRFQTIVNRLDLPRRPLPTVTAQQMERCKTRISKDHDRHYSVPSLEELAGLSPFLRFGCLSCRLRKRCSPPLSLFGQLLWREFFYTAATNNPSFDRMEGNPICVQIPWDQNPEALAKWAEGRTGFPWIDAIMTQLRREGWIHHLARHAVFEELLLDADWSVNAGSWMWLSCSAFFQQFFHCYCPVGFGRRTDPSGDYIRRYIPILKDYPNRYIYEPWSAPLSVQKAANCVVGVDYPKPMINHAEASRLNIERMKQVYQQLSHYRGLNSPVHEPAARPLVPDSSTARTSSPAADADASHAAAHTQPPQTPPSSSASTHTSTFPAFSPTPAIASVTKEPATVFLPPPQIPFPSSHAAASSQSPARDPAATPGPTPVPDLSHVTNPFVALSPRPVTLAAAGQHAAFLGHRKKGQPRKHRRTQRSRGLLGGAPAGKADGGAKAAGRAGEGEEEHMEEDVVFSRTG
ncbi:hypothetical protein CRUP_008234 [Coryphaenoides rupestris]|nr:hypothetical protein CRUP_008234 [Coryphaenoides rupestris]